MYLFLLLNLLLSRVIMCVCVPSTRDVLCLLMLENIGLGLFPFTEVQHPEKNVFSISQRVRSIVSEFP